MQQLDRSKGIGCSDLPVIMGVSPWSNAYKLWEEKLSGKSGQLDNPAMRYGRETEPLIRELVEGKTGFALPPVRIVHPEKYWLWASLDGYNSERKTIAEFKTANKDDHLITISGKVPEKYWPQVQGQMEVVGADHLLYCSYHAGDLEVLKVQKDEEYCSVMMEKAEEFWECVVLEVPPEGYVCMKGDETWNHTAEELKSIRGLMKALKEQDDDLMEKLKGLSKGCSAKGSKVFLHRQECVGSIKYGEAIKDYLSNMRAHHPDIEFPDIPLEAYRKKTFEKWILRDISKN
jgi:putative phage-type endonuclease